MKGGTYMYNDKKGRDGGTLPCKHMYYKTTPIGLDPIDTTCDAVDNFIKEEIVIAKTCFCDHCRYRIMMLQAIQQELDNVRRGNPRHYHKESDCHCCPFLKR